MSVVICKSTRNGAGCGHPVTDHDGGAHRDCCCCNGQHNDPSHADACIHCWGRRIKAQLGGAATVGEIAPHMPERLRPAFWRWAVGEYFRREVSG